MAITDLPEYISRRYMVKHYVEQPSFDLVITAGLSSPLSVSKTFTTHPEEFDIRVIDELGREHTLLTWSSLSVGTMGNKQGFRRVATVPGFRLQFKYKFVGLTIDATKAAGETYGELEFLKMCYDYKYLLSNIQDGNGLILTPHTGSGGVGEFDKTFQVLPIGNFEPKYINKKYLDYRGAGLKSSYEIIVGFETIETYSKIPLDLINGED